MPVLRNELATIFSGGPRQYGEIRDKFLIRVKENSPVGDLLSELDRFNLEGAQLRSVPVVIAEPRNSVADVLDRFRQLERDDVKVRQAFDEVRDAGEQVIQTTTALLDVTKALLTRLSEIPVVDVVQFVQTFSDFGPEQLRNPPSDLRTIAPNEADQESGTMDELNSNLNLPQAWDVTRGENAVIAIFDTGFDQNLFSSSRVIETFSAGGTDSVQAPAEGHGTMTAGAAAASKEDGVPFNGSAPGADVILCRITDENGQIRSDIISKAWDFIMGLNLNRPIIANHSYGTPICSGRPKTKFCNGPSIDLVKRASSDSNITSVYAAGNEAGYCGHRLSGITNGITGLNSIAEVITVGALRFDEVDAQRYSSHGRGDCAPVADPKPNVSNALPNKTYYGTEEGWKIKDMSTGIGGSSGGTSHASPTVAGMIALIQSAAVERRGEALQTEEVKQIIADAAVPPRPTQINSFGFLAGPKGYDARFGHGQIDILNALDQI